MPAPNLTSTCVQVAVGLSDMDSHFKWRDRDNPKIAARTTVNLHSLAEGEVLEGWHKLRPREARAQDGMCLAADERHAWAAPWRKCAPACSLLLCHHRCRSRRSCVRLYTHQVPHRNPVLDRATGVVPARRFSSPHLVPFPRSRNSVQPASVLFVDVTYHRAPRAGPGSSART